MNRRGTDAEVFLHVGFGRRATVQPGVQVDIGQILALLGGEGFSRATTPAIRRTVSRDTLSCVVSLTMSPAGGLEQAVATRKASSLPLNLRSAPRRGSSLSAASRLPSRRRSLAPRAVQ